MLRRALREPLVQFVLLGSALFLLSGWLGPRPDRRVVVTSGQIDRLFDTFARTWQRPPTLPELQGLIDSSVQEEIYYREGVRLGLDRDDEVIRRRIRMKMELWNDNAAEAREPTEQELEAFLAAHPEKFRESPRATFRQVFVSTRRGDRAKQDAARLLEELRRGADPAAIGDPLPLPESLESAPLDEVVRVFGESFAAGIANLPVGSWGEPVESGYGLHLIRVDARTETAAPELPAVRDAVTREWFAERREQASRELYDQLRRQYTVVVEPWKPSGVPTARAAQGKP